MIYLTSFYKSGELPPEVKRFSAAVYQPDGFNYPKIFAFDIRSKGKWIRPREFKDKPRSLMAYHDALYAHYLKREVAIQTWLYKFGDTPVALCCWCPYEKAAQHQLNEWGSFVCHLSVVGEFLHDLGAQVWYDGDRLIIYHRRTILE